MVGPFSGPRLEAYPSRLDLQTLEKRPWFFRVHATDLSMDLLKPYGSGQEEDLIRSQVRWSSLEGRDQLLGVL